MRLADIHTHLAWGIDDGYQTKEDTMNALAMMKKQGVQYVVSTPHFIPGNQGQNEVINMNKRIQDLQELAKNYGIQVFKGCELFLNHNFMDMVDDKLVNTIGNSHYLLAEFNVTRELGKSEQVEDRLYELAVRDYNVVIAHVERYFHKGLDVPRVKEWFNQGYIIQVNTSSLLGIHGNQVKKNAFKLIEQGLAHVVGTDTHGSQGRRNPNLSEAYRLIEKQYGKETADILCFKNTIHILKNETVENIPVTQTSFFKKLFRKG